MGIWYHWNHCRLRDQRASLIGVSGSFSELTKDFSPEQRERIEQRKEQLRQEMTLAKNLNVKQAGMRSGAGTPWRRTPRLMVHP